MCAAAAPTARTARLFDAHCHLQDPRIAVVASRLIATAASRGVVRFAVNGTSEKDWELVKQMADRHPCVIPCFGLHPWYIKERTTRWFEILRHFLTENPTASVGEIGLDKGSHGKSINFCEQVEVFQHQLELAKELKRPVSVHCVRAFGDLLEILKKAGPFPDGVLLHSFMGSAEMVADLTKIGGYFSLSGFLTEMKPEKAKKLLRAIPLDKILLETDAPDGLPKVNQELLVPVFEDGSKSDDQVQQNYLSSGGTTLPRDTLNHPANIHTVLSYVSSLLEMPESTLADVSYQNAVHLFSYSGSKLDKEDCGSS